MMLDMRTYTRQELIDIFKTDRLDSIKAKIQRRGYIYTTSGRGDTFTMTITGLPPRFKTFCIERLGFAPQTDFERLKVFLYCVVLQIIYGFMLHFIYNHFQDYPECHITLFKPDYAHKILLSKTKHIILTRMRLLTARTFGFSVMFD